MAPSNPGSRYVVASVPCGGTGESRVRTGDGRWHYSTRPGEITTQDGGTLGWIENGQIRWINEPQR